MELTAAIKAFQALKQKSNVIIHTDSKYLKNGITSWIYNWKKNGWKTKDKKPIKNVELWKILDEEVSKHIITWKWVEGHSGNNGNEKADELANIAIKQFLSKKIT
jgi:ribonuclease HI